MECEIFRIETRKQSFIRAFSICMAVPLVHVHQLKVKIFDSEMFMTFDDIYLIGEINLKMSFFLKTVFQVYLVCDPS